VWATHSADEGDCRLTPPPSRSLMRYLLGTNIVSELIRDPRGRVTVREVGEANVATSIIVAAELH
jgi:hypothetical protein